MTTKEIAESVGKDVSTVQRWIKKMNGKMQSIDGKMQSSTSTNPADFTEDETLAIIENGMGKNAAGIYRMNIKASKDDFTEMVTKADLATFGTAIVTEVIKQLLPLIQSPVEKQEPLAIEAPGMALRDQLRKIVDQAAKESGDYQGTWNMLYSDIRYRLHINVNERAKNAGVSKLDILEAEGHLMSAILIAKELFNK